MWTVAVMCQEQNTCSEETAQLCEEVRECSSTNKDGDSSQTINSRDLLNESTRLAKSTNSGYVEVSTAKEIRTPDSVLKTGQSDSDTRPGLQCVSDYGEQLGESADL